MNRQRGVNASADEKVNAIVRVTNAVENSFMSELGFLKF